MKSYASSPRRQYTGHLEFLYKRDLCILHLFTYSIIYLYQWGVIDIYFVVWVYNPILLSFIVHIFPALAVGNSLSWPHCPFDIPLIIVTVCVCVCVYWPFPYFMALQKCSRLILYIPYSSLKINHFLKKFWFPLLKNGT